MIFPRTQSTYTWHSHNYGYQRYKLLKNQGQGSKLQLSLPPCYK